MKNRPLVLLLVLASLALFEGTRSVAQEAGEAPKKLETPDQKASYAVGFRFGDQLRTNLIIGQGAPLDKGLLVQGFQDALAEKKGLLTQQEIGQALQELDKRLKALALERSKAAQAKGEAWLAANKDKEGVVTLPSGLQYKVLREGEGAKPKASDQVKVHYKGTLIDGREFDSSYKRGTPTTFGLRRVIRGWTEGIPLMKVGAKWQFFIPASMAYGPRPPPQSSIPPNSTLIFEVELLEILGGGLPPGHPPGGGRPGGR